MASIKSTNNTIIRIEQKIDAVHDKIASIDVTLAKQEEQIAYHVKRTNLLEDSIKPIEKHVVMVHGVIKFIGLLAVLCGIIEAAVSLLTK